jgi:hypothetical protein
VHPVSDPDPDHLGTDGDNGSSGLMADRERSDVKWDVALDGEMDVTPVQPGSLDANQDISSPEAWNGDGLEHHRFARMIEPNRPHRGW